MPTKRSATTTPPTVTLGGRYFLSENWIAGAGFRGSGWILPETQRCSPIGDGATLSSAVEVLELGLTIGERSLQQLSPRGSRVAQASSQFLAAARCYGSSVRLFADYVLTRFTIRVALIAEACVTRRDAEHEKLFADCEAGPDVDLARHVGRRGEVERRWAPIRRVEPERRPLRRLV